VIETSLRIAGFETHANTLKKTERLVNVYSIN
jgi:hypothetical protein